jgi:hypothetical protein
MHHLQVEQVLLADLRKSWVRKSQKDRVLKSQIRKVSHLRKVRKSNNVGHGMKWLDLLYECSAWWNRKMVVSANEMKQEW